MRYSVLLVPLLAACSETPSAPRDVTGPFSGPMTRFAVDRFVLPANNADAQATADDLDGNMTVDNQVGYCISSLLQSDDSTVNDADMVAAGVVASSLVLQAPDLDHADRAGATYFGVDGAPAETMGGEITNGTFTSNRTRTTRVPGNAILHLPVFADADPAVFELDAMEVDLTPDGNGGYDAVLRGGVTLDRLSAAVGSGLEQMIRNDPQDHLLLAHLSDANHDGVVTADELAHNALIRSQISPDVTLFGQPMTSLAIKVHLVPCEIGTCASSAPADRCHDRVRDGDETDIDCGGSCGACAGGAMCALAGDCQSRACDAGTCRAPSCSDGLLDGIESDVDCGEGCALCALGKRCMGDADCASGHCSSELSLGTCM